MITEEIKELVVGEATNLRKYITPEEKERLDISSLDGSSASSCVYGQLTGNCYSDRARQLIQKCCERVYISNNGHLKDDLLLNGSPIGKRRDKEDMNWLRKPNVEYYSPIEVLLSKLSKDGEVTISKDEGSPADKLVKFIKGQTDSLTL